MLGVNRTGVVELRFFTIHLGPKSPDSVAAGLAALLCQESISMVAFFSLS